MTKAQAGKLGGLATKANQPEDYFSKIGKKGGIAFWEKYTLKPYNTYQFALIERSTGKIINPNWPFGG